MATTPTISAAPSYPSDATATSDAMVIDTHGESFDFFSLEDPNLAVSEQIRKDYAPPEAKAKGKTSKEPEPVVEEEEEYEESEGEDADDLDFEDLDDGEYEDESDDEESDEAEETDSEDDEPDEQEVEFDEYEVTLPSGETLKLSEAVHGYKAAKALEEERHAFEEAKNKFEDSTKDIQSYLDLAKLESLRVIEDYDDFDWAGLARTDPAAYVDNKEFLEKYKERYNEIVTAQKNLEKTRQAEEAAAMETKAIQCNTILARDIPGWNKELYQSLMEFGVENGASEQEMLSCVDPTTFKILHKAMQFDKGRAIVKAKIKQVVKQPTKVVKKASKEAPKMDSKKTAVIKKVSSGGATARDMDDMFSMLVD